MKSLKDKNLFLLTTAQSISLFGDRLNNMALLGILGSYYSQSTFVFSGLAMFITLPSILFSPISGIISDKFNRKKIMIIIEILRAIIVASIPFIFLNLKNILAVYFMIFLLYSLTILFNNAKMASIPDMVKNVYTANAFLNITGRLSIAIGILFGGIVVDLSIWKNFNIEGWQAAFYIDAITYILSATLILFITVESRNSSKIEFSEIIEKERSFFRGLFEDFKFGLNYVKNDIKLFFVFKCLILTMLVISISYNIYLPYFQQNLGFGTKGIGITGLFVGIGLLVGSLIFPTIVKKFGEIKIITYSHFIISAMFIVSIFIKELFVLLMLFFVGGIFLSLLLMSYDTFIQSFYENSIRGRLFSFKEFLWSTSFLLFVFLLGTLGEFLKLFFNFERAIKIIILTSGLIIIFLNFSFYRQVR
ncbi:MAG: MFS transporter [candidate division WOR-3 bacterium]|nr:MFS transporter [candidate division WOR-3 bacterium]MCX7948405.1 MFS transporter [candidate division WOR-3 bacterium]MDW8150383.1 MFS transporter [candidate division WOR-3 bacterium]